MRIGINTGWGNIKFDEVTKGFDYYGTVSNVAARTESCAHGGQIVATKSAMDAMNAALRDTLSVDPLGPQPLRGVSEPVELFQVNSIEGRKHPPLRIDREIDEDLLAEPDKYEKSGLSQDSKATDSSREVEVLVNIRAFVPTVLSVVCTPLPNNVRSKVVRSLCEAWRVRCKGSATANAVDAWINALSKRIAPVLLQKLKGANANRRHSERGRTQRLSVVASFGSGEPSETISSPQQASLIMSFPEQPAFVCSLNRAHNCM